MRSRVLAVGVFVLLVITTFTSVVWAHHARAGYGDKDQTMKGTVVEFKWRNPHVFITYEVKGSDGKVVQWVGELSSVTTMIGMGMTRQSLKAGDEIVVTAIVAKTGTPESLLRKVSKSDGSIVVDMGQTNLREP
jgi:hypothetical protein